MMKRKGDWLAVFFLLAIVGLLVVFLDQFVAVTKAYLNRPFFKCCAPLSYQWP